MDFGRTRDKRTSFPKEVDFDNECLYVQQFGKALLSRTVQQAAQISQVLEWDEPKGSFYITASVVPRAQIVLLAKLDCFRPTRAAQSPSLFASEKQIGKSL